MSERVTIECENIQLEGVLQKNTREKAVIICHPHPVYGGNMDNPIVMTMEESFFEKGFTTLRFNFRGTCNSTGQFDNGNGEQEDILAAISYLVGNSYRKISLAGYSFGARMTAAVISKGCKIEDHIMVSPPVGFMSFDDIQDLPCTGLVVMGANDEIAPVALVKRHITNWQINPQVEIIENCDHFYSGCLPRLKTILTDYLS